VDPALVLDPEHRATPIDRGDVCLNVDKSWFAEHDVAPPNDLADLTDPHYRNLLVVENPATSTPGLAFMLATIAHFGEDGWHDYWRQLRANGVLVVDGWEDAYYARFSGASGSKGTRPIVVSYASSPPAEVIFAKPRPATAPTGVVESSCYRQIELAGVLRGAKNADGARALIDFMLSRPFQEDVPLQMFVFPARPDAALPPEFEKFAVVPPQPLELPPEEVEANRERWVDEWTDIVVR
jgi:thiamine transport system substrate-binding protein